MPIDVQWEIDARVEGAEALLKAACEAAFALEGIENAGMAVRVTTPEEIRSLNLRMRGIDRETDVLSFPTVRFRPGTTARDNPRRVRREYDPALGYANLGDCAISLKRAKEQAALYGHSLSRELGYLAAHSAFHLMGYDHETPEDRARMRELEERAMERVSLTRTEENPMDDRQLFDMACEAMHGAYAPYSNFQVGAALLSTDGRVFQGVNIENASYGATICAERAAIAVVGSGAQSWPCGICRQVLHEFSDDMRVICGQYGGDFDVVRLSELLPHAFGPEHLEGNHGK